MTDKIVELGPHQTEKILSGAEDTVETLSNIIQKRLPKIYPILGDVTVDIYRRGPEENFCIQVSGAFGRMTVTTYSVVEGLRLLVVELIQKACSGDATPSVMGAINPVKLVKDRTR